MPPRTTILTVGLLVASLHCPLPAAEIPDGVPFVSVRQFGAVGDGKTEDTDALQRAIDTAHDTGGGTVVLPPGTYLTGTLFMKSRVTLHLAREAVLLGSADVEDYPINRCAFPSVTDRYCARALIWGEGLEDIGIVGQGTIDGQGGQFRDNRLSEQERDKLLDHWEDAGRYRPLTGYINRPYIIRLVSCRNILIEGITLRDSPMWMQHYLDCDSVTVRGISVYNHVGRNNDMIDIDCCRNVVITDCFADTDDDALTLKSTAGRPTENVTVSNCLLSSHCNAIKAGTESNGGFKNITITNCVIRPSADSEKIAGRNEGLAGIALEIVDGGTLDGVTISNIAMVGETTPIFLRLGNRARPIKPSAPKPSVGTFRNVILSNIVATGAGAVGCSIAGLPDHPIENVTLSNIRISFVGGGTKEHAQAAVPENPTKYPECTMFGTLPAYGFYCRHVAGLTLRSVDLRFAKPDHRPALVCDDVRDLAVDAFSAQTSAEASAQIVLDNTRDALIRGCCPPPTAAVFLRLQDRSDRITVVANDLSRTETPFAFGKATPRSALHATANRARIQDR